MCEGLDRLRAALGEAFCTACRYCMPCPHGVDIPRHMEIHRNWKAFGLDQWARETLKAMPAESGLDNCDRCGACEEKCPNRLSVREILDELAGLRGDAKPAGQREDT